MASPTSSDEGEILENGGGNSKATSLPRFDATGVDRPDRHRARFSTSRSPGHENGSRNRSSRSPRGFKRPRDEHDPYPAGRLNSDPRRFRVHYEDDRFRAQYEDEDRPPPVSSASSLRYDDGERTRDRNRARDHSRDRKYYPEKRPRNRTRSPRRPLRAGNGGRDRDDRFRRNDDRSRRPSDRDGGRSTKYDRDGRHSPRRMHEGSALDRETSVESATAPRDDAKYAKGHSSGETDIRLSARAHELQPEPEPEEEVLDEEDELERRRRRRAELLAKTRGPTPMLVQALQASEKATLSSPAHTETSTPMMTEANTPRSGRPAPHPGRYSETCTNPVPAMSSPSSPGRGLQEGMSPVALDISNDQELINRHGTSRDIEDDGPSAADYDPTADMREDEMRDELRNGHVGPHGGILPAEEKAEIAPKEEPAPSKEPAAGKGDDDDDFDMFAEEFDEEKFAAPKPNAPADVVVDDRKVPAAVTQPNGAILQGDDKDGYYKIRIGEIMNGRYQVQATLGKGMFSGVARAVDITSKKLVAIKMMRNNDALRKGGYVEIAILQKLNDADPENRKHIVKFERHFEHQGHLCLAFENLSLNLREVLRKFGNNVGINLSATRAYAHQMFVALAHMRKCTIIHADIKPDNILVSLGGHV